MKVKLFILSSSRWVICESKGTLKFGFGPFSTEIWSKKWNGILDFQEGSKFHFWRPVPRTPRANPRLFANFPTKTNLRKKLKFFRETFQFFWLYLNSFFLKTRCVENSGYFLWRRRGYEKHRKRKQKQIRQPSLFIISWLACKYSSPYLGAKHFRFCSVFLSCAKT